MSIVQFFKPENRLAKIITTPGGKFVTDAVEDANAQLLEVSDNCLNEVDQVLARIYRSTTAIPTGAELSSLYRSVREVAGLAAICDLPDLGTAALSFCALLDHAQEGGRVTEEHLRISSNVLRMLRHPELLDKSGRCSLLENLDALVEKSSARDAAESL